MKKLSLKSALSYLKQKLANIPFLNEFLLMRAVSHASDIDDHRNRQLRARVLRFFANRLLSAMQKVNYRQGILTTEGEVYVFSEGIFLNARNNNRYFKVSVNQSGNEGKALLSFLQIHNISVRTMIDLGACHGEISLYFCRNLPEAKILAVEASPENFSILQSNCKFQLFPVENLIPLNEAVADKSGMIQITRGRGGGKFDYFPGRSG